MTCGEGYRQNVSIPKVHLNPAPLSNTEGIRLTSSSMKHARVYTPVNKAPLL